jgi:hypothetical protein
MVYLCMRVSLNITWTFKKWWAVVNNPLFHSDIRLNSVTEWRGFYLRSAKALLELPSTVPPKTTLQYSTFAVWSWWFIPNSIFADYFNFQIHSRCGMCWICSWFGVPCCLQSVSCGWDKQGIDVYSPCEYDDPHFCLSRMWFLHSFFPWSLTFFHAFECLWRLLCLEVEKQMLPAEKLGLRRQQLNKLWHPFFSVHAVV